MSQLTAREQEFLDKELGLIRQLPEYSLLYRAGFQRGLTLMKDFVIFQSEQRARVAARTPVRMARKTNS